MALLVCTGAAVAQQAEPIRREILALYDGSTEGSAEASRIHRFAELPLNHLGYIVRFHDIRQALPDAASLARFRGVLTWFSGSVPDSNAYLAWINDVMKLPVQFVILGDIGVDATPRNLFLLNRFLGTIGLQHSGEFVTPARGTKIAHKDTDLVEFECQLDPVLPDYPIVVAGDPGLRIGLAVDVPPREGPKKSTLVAVSDRGGFAALNYEFCHQRAPTHKGRWLINPFAFFSGAFGRELVPIPDVTTVSGRRLYFGQLHSEGWNNASQLERYRHPPTSAAEVVLRELIEPFPGLPLTLDLRDSDLMQRGSAQPTAVALKENILAKPQVSRPGLLAIGTKLSRFDIAYPSIASLSALKSPAASGVYYTPTGDEASYAEGTRLRPTDVSRLTETLLNTEVPRRLKGVNINFHAYAGQHSSTLHAIKTLFQSASQMPLTPISAGHYAEIVDGFFGASIVPLGPLTWSITDRGALNTLRFERASGFELDLDASSGVLGESRHGDALYIALDEIALVPTIALRKAGPPTLKPDEGERLALVESTWRLRRLVTSTCYMSFEAQGFGDGVFSWAHAGPFRRRIRVVRGVAELWQGEAIADTDGRLNFKLPVQGIEPMVVEITCDN